MWSTRLTPTGPNRPELLAVKEALTDRIVGYQWDLAELRDLLGELSKATRPEVGALLALDEPAATAA